MANFIIGGLVLLAVGAAVWKLAADKKAGKGSCSCGGDCSKCHGCH